MARTIKFFAFLNYLKHVLHIVDRNEIIFLHRILALEIHLLRKNKISLWGLDQGSNFSLGLTRSVGQVVSNCYSHLTKLYPSLHLIL